MEEDLQREIARAKKRKWIKFAIVAAVTVALVGACIGGDYAFYFTEGLVRDGSSTAIVWLSIAGTLLGSLALYTVVDTLSGYHTVPVKILKIVLKAAGIGLMIVANFLSIAVGGFSSEMPETNPWIIGLYGTGYIGAVIATLTFYWNKRIIHGPKGVDPDRYLEQNALQISRAVRFGMYVYPYVSVASIAIGYLLSVIFAYIGIAVHRFFYVWFGVILCIIAIIVSIAVFFKKFAKRKNRQYRGSGDENPPTTPKTADADHKDGKRRMERVFYSRLLPYASDVGAVDVDWEKSAYMVNYNHWWNASKIIVGGKIKCSVHKADADYAAGICQNIRDKTVENIEREIKSVLKELCSEYSNYGYVDDYEIDCRGVSVGSCKLV